MDTPYTQGFKAGMAYENERIIKLLESIEGHGWIKIQFMNVIELIKGETNE